MPTPKLFDTTQIDLDALAAKNRKLGNKNYRLRMLLKRARPSVEYWYNHYQARLGELNGRQHPENYVNEAREIIDEMEEHRKLLEAIDGRLDERDDDRLPPILDATYGKKFVQSVMVEFSRSKQFGYDAKKLEALEEMAEALILEGLKLAEE